MKDNKLYVIKDLDSFINTTRTLVFNNFGKLDKQSSDIDILDQVGADEIDEFNAVLSYDESITIAKEILKKQINKKTLKERYLVSDSMYMQIVESLNARMVGNILNNLVNKGLVETAFDEESNDFIFWCVDNDKQNKNENPETD
jgi:hypothetical protein